MRPESQAIFEKNFTQFWDIFTLNFCTICLLTKLVRYDIMEKRAGPDASAPHKKDEDYSSSSSSSHKGYSSWHFTIVLSVLSVI